MLSQVFAPNVAVEVKTPDGTFVPKGTTLAILRSVPTTDDQKQKKAVKKYISKKKKGKLK